MSDSKFLDFLKQEGFILIEDEDDLPDGEREIEGYMAGSCAPNMNPDGIGFVDLWFYIPSIKRWYATELDDRKNWDYKFESAMTEASNYLAKYKKTLE
jgi:hypothetical protein